MKTIQKAGSFGAVLTALALLAASPASAHTTLSRPASGVVESLDFETRTLWFTTAPGQAPRQFVVTRQTKFIHDSHFAPASELKPGAKAVVYYRSPFFGKPFITKVVWSNGG